MPRKIALAGAMWIAGSDTVEVPVDNGDGTGSWQSLPLYVCGMCKQIAPANPCTDCSSAHEVSTRQSPGSCHTVYELQCRICGVKFKANSNVATCSILCSTLLARKTYEN